eukprot:TRINITY_DN30566_c0_g1_i1.p1 TRINITY_DN30566_c0_g1~~TRINITY_DN30566_c0_g1_i1.p1  ORF type:complete len:404 (+),score=80.64 TRINITY_DN30566_c0_g1_i1:38-1213(+)
MASGGPESVALTLTRGFLTTPETLSSLPRLTHFWRNLASDVLLPGGRIDLLACTCLSVNIEGKALLEKLASVCGVEVSVDGTSLQAANDVHSLYFDAERITQWHKAVGHRDGRSAAAAGDPQLAAVTELAAQLGDLKRDLASVADMLEEVRDFAVTPGDAQTSKAIAERINGLRKDVDASVAVAKNHGSVSVDQLATQLEDLNSQTRAVAVDVQQMREAGCPRGNWQEDPVASARATAPSSPEAALEEQRLRELIRRTEEQVEEHVKQNRRLSMQLANVYSDWDNDVEAIHRDYLGQILHLEAQLAQREAGVAAQKDALPEAQLAQREVGAAVKKDAVPEAQREAGAAAQKDAMPEAQLAQRDVGAAAHKDAVPEADLAETHRRESEHEAY